MGDEEPFHLIGGGIIRILDIFQMSMPEMAGIPQVFCKISIQTFIKIEDFRVKFGRVVDSANVALEIIHCFEATDCEFAMIFRFINEEPFISAAAWVGEKFCDRCMENLNTAFIINSQDRAKSVDQ